MKKIYKLAIAIICLQIIITLLTIIINEGYITVHYDIVGNPDAYGNKYACLAIPILGVLFYNLFIYIKGKSLNLNYERYLKKDLSIYHKDEISKCINIIIDTWNLLVQLFLLGLSMATLLKCNIPAILLWGITSLFILSIIVFLYYIKKIAYIAKCN